MSCEHYLDLISARLDGPLSPEDEAALSEHLNTCPACRATARDLEGLHTELTGCAVPPPAELAAGVMSAIHGKRSSRRRTLRQLGALAACLVLCAGLFTLTRPEPTEDPAGVPDMARHVEPAAQTEGLPVAASEELSFAHPQQLRLSADAATGESCAALLGDTDALSRFLARFPHDDLSPLAQTYNEGFFSSHRLLAVVLQEPSSSISHSIANLTTDCVTILRRVPEAGDTDMARWLLLAEVGGAGPETPLVMELLDN